MKTLLKTIRENDKELDGLLQSIISYAVNKSDELGTQKNYVKTKITQSRIKELEVLVEMIKEREYLDIKKLLQDTIKELRDAR